MLELKNIYKTYNAGTVNEHRLFSDFNLKVSSGQFVSVVGSNGSGKTSMLNLICGSMNPDKGNIYIDNGKEKIDLTTVKEYKRHKFIGRVYQNPAKGTCPSMTILENMAIADNKGTAYGIKPCIKKSRVEYYVEQLKTIGLDLESKLDVKVGSLSGGQRQCLAMLMCTMNPIDFLILDEHTAALDPKTERIVMEMTESIVKSKGVTTLMVTHNLRDALRYGDRILMMNSGEFILDKEGEEKKQLDTDYIMEIFNNISVEKGN